VEFVSTHAALKGLLMMTHTLAAGTVNDLAHNA
jgi:hypothetical protein